MHIKTSGWGSEQQEGIEQPTTKLMTYVARCCAIVVTRALSIADIGWAVAP